MGVKHRRYDGEDELWEASIERRLGSLESYRTKHEQECHPAILTWQAKATGKVAIVSGIMFVIGSVVGALVTGILLPLVVKWVGG